MLNGFLRQSTASQSRNVGPFVDDTDFKSVETGLTIANTDVKLSKNGAASVNKNSGGGTHVANGKYALTFDATDTNTVGELDGSILVSGALVVAFKFMVLEEAVYDLYYASGAGGPMAASLSTLAQGKPSATPDFDEAIMRLYWKEIYALVKVDTDSANQVQIFDDAGTVVLWEHNISDASNVFTRNEAQTGA